jgi:hypothetical protein
MVNFEQKGPRPRSASFLADSEKFRADSCEPLKAFAGIDHGRRNRVRFQFEPIFRHRISETYPRITHAFHEAPKGKAEGNPDRLIMLLSATLGADVG